MPSDAASIHLERRVFHALAASGLPVVALLLPLSLVQDLSLAQGLALGAALAMVAAEVGRRLSPRLNRLFVRAFGRMMRPAEEQGRITGATYLACASAAALLLYPPSVAALALLFHAWGDPAAAMVGSRFGRLRLPALGGGSPQRKTLEGSLAFFCVSLVVSAVLWASGAFDVFWPAAVGALVAAVVELVRLPVDDNATVPLVSGGLMAVLWVG